MSPTPDPRAVRELAYRLWEEHGRPDDAADAYWLEAERRLTEVLEDFTRSDAPTLNAGAMWAEKQSDRANPADGTSRGPRNTGRK